MVILDKSKFPSFKANLEVDVSTLFGPKTGTPKIEAPTVAELAKERVQYDFAQLTTLHGPAQDKARRNFIDALQVYNSAVYAHQSDAIAKLDSPFISTPEMLRQSTMIQTAMQRDVIANVRDQALKLAADAQDLWGSTQQSKQELRTHFKEVAQQYSGALSQLDEGHAAAAFTTYRRVASANDDHLAWMSRSLRHSEDLKKAAGIGITAVAATVAVVLTDGVALAALGPNGMAALSGGSRLGLIIGNGAAFTLAHRTLEQKIIHIPFLRKEGVVANALDLGVDMGRTAVLMGFLKMVGEVAPIALPIAKTEPALAALRNFSAEFAGFNVFDVAMGSNPSEIFSKHHQLDLVAFLLGLRTANGVIAGVRAAAKALPKLSPKKDAAERIEFARGVARRAEVMRSAAMATRDPFQFQKWMQHPERGVFLWAISGAAFGLLALGGVTNLSVGRDRVIAKRKEQDWAQYHLKMAAIKKLGEVESPETTQELIRIAESSESTFGEWIESARVLGERKAQKAIPVLKMIAETEGYDNDVKVSAMKAADAAVDALGNMGSVEARDILMSKATLEVGYYSSCARAIHVLSKKFPDSDGLVTLLHSAAQHMRPGSHKLAVQYATAAVDALGVIGSTDARDALMDFIKPETPGYYEVQARAIHVLAKTFPDAPGLVSLLYSVAGHRNRNNVEPAKQYAMAAVEALGTLGSVDARDALMDFIKPETLGYYGAQSRAIRFAANLFPDAEGLVSLLHSAAEHVNPKVPQNALGYAKVAVWALGQIQGEGATNALTQISKSSRCYGEVADLATYELRERSAGWSNAHPKKTKKENGEPTISYHQRQRNRLR